MGITVPGLGRLTDDGDWLVSEPRYVAALGESCRFQLDGYGDDSIPASAVYWNPFS